MLYLSDLRTLQAMPLRYHKRCPHLDDSNLAEKLEDMLPTTGKHTLATARLAVVVRQPLELPNNIVCHRMHRRHDEQVHA